MPITSQGIYFLVWWQYKSLIEANKGQVFMNRTSSSVLHSPSASLPRMTMVMMTSKEKQRKNTSRKSAKDGRRASERERTPYVDCMRGLHSTMYSTPFLIEMRLCERANVLFERKFVRVQCQFKIITLKIDLILGWPLNRSIMCCGS